MRSALDDLLGRWHAAACWGQPLVTFPTPGVRWEPRATEWHVDLCVIPGNPLPCVKLLALLSALEPRGGGTLVVTGSHRLAMQLAAERGETREPLRSADLRRRLARADTWLATFWAREGGEDRCRKLMDGGACVGGVELRVAEVTGEPGDVFLMHPYALHAASPNVRERPRLMLAQQVNRAGADAPT